MSPQVPGYPRMSRLVQPRTIPKVPGLKYPLRSWNDSTQAQTLMLYAMYTEVEKEASDAIYKGG